MSLSAVSWLLGLLGWLLVGWLVYRLRVERGRAAARVEEAERLRDELGRRGDILEASNRCARALASSLRLDEAFDAFIEELRGLIPFDRAAILLVEGEQASVTATAGLGADWFLANATDVLREAAIDEVTIL